VSLARIHAYSFVLLWVVRSASASIAKRPNKVSLFEWLFHKYLAEPTKLTPACVALSYEFGANGITALAEMPTREPMTVYDVYDM
jgi:hypothetical protein